MNRLTKWLFINRSVEEIIFSCILVAGIPYFMINEIIDLYTNQSISVFIINVSLLLIIGYLLRLSLKRALKKIHIFAFSLILSIGFVLFWPASTGLAGAGAYVMQSLIIILLLVNTGKATTFFAIGSFVMIYIAGFVDIDYTGKIVYRSQLISFTLNMIVIALIVNIFKSALDRERKRLVFRINKLDRINAEIQEKNEALKKNQEEIKRIQTQLQQIIKDRTEEIEKENERIVNYAFINAHLVRAPLANMLGISQLMKSKDPQFKTLKKRIEKLDGVVRKIGGVLSVENKSRRPA